MLVHHQSRWDNGWDSFTALFESSLTAQSSSVRLQSGGKTYQSDILHIKGEMEHEIYRYREKS